MENQTHAESHFLLNFNNCLLDEGEIEERSFPKGRPGHTANNRNMKMKYTRNKNEVLTGEKFIHCACLFAFVFPCCLGNMKRDEA